METTRTIAQLRAAIGGANRCALVPTMGNLHDGHLALVAQAQRDIGRLPVGRPASSSTACSSRRTKTSTAIRGRSTRDCDQLRAAGCDLVFAPPKAELYPAPQRLHACIRTRRWPDILEGAVPAGLLRRRLHGRDEALLLRAAGVGGVRQEGLPAVDGRPPHGRAVRAADRRSVGHRDRARRRRPGAVVAQRLPRCPGERAQATALASCAAPT